MTADLYWLTLTALMTSLMWLPYVLNRIIVRGLFDAMRGSADEGAPHSEWAERARLAHANAIESIGIFAALVLTAHVTGLANDLTASAAMIYFLARLAHYFIFIFKIPVARTLSFAVSWVSMLIIALVILGVL